MRAVAVTALGDPDVLRVVERPDPVAAAGQVLVRVRAACVHRADTRPGSGRFRVVRSSRRSCQAGISPVK